MLRCGCAHQKLASTAAPIKHQEEGKQQKGRGRDRKKKKQSCVNSSIRREEEEGRGRRKSRRGRNEKVKQRKGSKNAKKSNKLCFLQITPYIII